MKGGDTIIRTILITECEHKITKERRLFYGRYDPVTLERQKWRILDSHKEQYTMTDEEFVRHAKKKEK